MHIKKLYNNLSKLCKLLKDRGLQIDESKMSTFVSHYNPLTGKTEWSFQDENYDYHQEIAR